MINLANGYQDGRTSARDAWVDLEDAERLEDAARAADRSRSAEVRLAIREHLERTDQTEEESHEMA